MTSCVCCIELIHWHPSGLGKLCLTLRSGRLYCSWPSMRARIGSAQCAQSVDVMAGLTTTLKVAMFRLRDPDNIPWAAGSGIVALSQSVVRRVPSREVRPFSALINPNKLDASRLLGWLLSERIEQVG